MSERDGYAQVGVNYAVIDPGKLLAQRTALGTAANLVPHGARELTASRGESAYVFALGERYLATVTEALGTKNLVADSVGPALGKSFYDAIARDAVATIINDLVTVGARPLCLTAYWGAGSSEWFENGARLADLVSGWGAACDEAGCAWGGGETQVLKGMIDPGTVVLGGSAIGTIVKPEQLLLGSRVAAGDQILIAPSVGIHTNGLTLARELAGRAANGYLTALPGDPAGRSIGEALLDPTPLYARLVAALLDGGVELHYAVHVTGHGLRKLMRAEQALTYVIDALPPVPPVLAYLTGAASMGAEEAYGTFNMGAGFALYVANESVERAQTIGAELNVPLLHAGRVVPGPRRVVLSSVGITFEGETLAIR